MRNRVTGIMRVKNEGPFIRNCIESCINALDELVVVYNDCTDNSADEIEKMVWKYPKKYEVTSILMKLEPKIFLNRNLKKLKHLPRIIHIFFPHMQILHYLK